MSIVQTFQFRIDPMAPLQEKDCTNLGKEFMLPLHSVYFLRVSTLLGLCCRFRSELTSSPTEVVIA